MTSVNSITLNTCDKSYLLPTLCFGDVGFYLI